MKVSIKFRPIAYIKAVRNAKKTNAQADTQLSTLREELTEQLHRNEQIAAEVKKQAARLERVQPQNREKVEAKLNGAQDKLDESGERLRGIEELIRQAEESKRPTPIRGDYLHFRINHLKVASNERPSLLRRVGQKLYRYVVRPVSWVLGAVVSAVAGVVAVAGLLVLAVGSVLGVIGSALTIGPKKFIDACKTSINLMSEALQGMSEAKAEFDRADLATA